LKYSGCLNYSFLNQIKSIQKLHHRNEKHVIMTLQVRLTKHDDADQRSGTKQNGTKISRRRKMMDEWSG